MLIKVKTDIIVDVEDEDQAEEACFQLSSGLDRALAGFPVGEVIDANVDGYEKVTDAEAAEQGWTEE